ncbi:uncharacterized protein C8R40DRAFT_1172939 [Lentinula edodes]|uniref:uncharacterized protein n=1 Tax=Lentinula edodes TaxID=5353 RepID=UPI001E8EE923|nr:uncharacterized protein C8R40DRAFT_1172939 [Lentinula edodes]KAH7873305.1 hypothetical protein C8R40DRAFT_1172939 [Lentinula edodes]
MTEPDNFISTYDEKSNPVDIPYPLTNGAPMHPSEVIRIHNKGELFFRCAHGMICEAWQINHRCGFYVKLNDIYGPLHQAHQLKASRTMEPYPSPPQSRKRPSSLMELPNTPTKRSKKIGKQTAKNTIPTPFPVDPNPPSTSYPKGSYYLLPPFEDNGFL